MAERSVAVDQRVPQDPAQRDAVRARVREWARTAALVPPLDLEHLRACADRIAREAGFAPEYRDFVTVLVGNAAWQPALAAVPFERRVLLLPRCLRDAPRCRAPVDALGLSCQRCGGCAIDGITAEAEALGSQVLVAEGTTTVASLVETGAVEAVVAVACLHSLERSYAAATAGAVPAIAIPLLGAGCRATAVDRDWVSDVLRLRADAPVGRRVDLDRLKERVRGWFGAAELGALLCGDGTEAEELALAAMAGGGKRWRPTLAAAVYEALTGGMEAAPGRLQRVAVAVECFHKASLVHDDIEDGDSRRDGAPTLQAAHGLPVALNAGDLLIGEGYRLIAEAGLDAGTTVRMVQVAAHAQRELCLGQGAELAWRSRPRPLAVAEALQLLRRKTAPAFEVPLVLGAMLAGADEGTCQALRELSAALGLAYQVRDDIEDVSATSASPLFVALACEQEGALLAQRLLDGRLPPPEHEALLARLRPACWRRFDELRAASLAALRPLADAPLKGMLFRLVHLFLGGTRGVAAARDEAWQGRADDAA